MFLNLPAFGCSNFEWKAVFIFEVYVIVEHASEIDKIVLIN